LAHRKPSDAPQVMKEENGQAAASTRCSPLRSMVFKISNDSIMIDFSVIQATPRLRIQQWIVATWPI
jgi:hypothetical protein